MMEGCPVGNFLKTGDLPQNFIGDQCVLLNDGEFFMCQFFRLFKNRSRNGELSDIMDCSGEVHLGLHFFVITVIAAEFSGF